jgi:hypothetical protein
LQQCNTPGTIDEIVEEQAKMPIPEGEVIFDMTQEEVDQVVKH